MNGLIERIEQGMTTDADARVVSAIVARLMRYELALRDIAIYGAGDPAMTAIRALTGDGTGHGREATH